MSTEKDDAAFATMFSAAVREQEAQSIGATICRPKGSNADEWHLYLQENQDALPMVAVQIAEAIEEAERRCLDWDHLEKTGDIKFADKNGDRT